MIPIEEKNIDAVVGRRCNLALHHLRVRLVLVAPKRNLGLLMPGKAGRGGFYQIPLIPSLAHPCLMSRLSLVVVSKIVNRHSEFLFLFFESGGR